MLVNMHEAMLSPSRTGLLKVHTLGVFTNTAFAVGVDSSLSPSLLFMQLQKRKNVFFAFTFCQLSAERENFVRIWLAQ